MTPSEKQSLADLVGRIIETHRDAPRISPASIATEAMEELDPAGMVKRGATLLWQACNLYLRQIARQLLAHRFMPDDEDETAELFVEGLQWRYPLAHSSKEDPVYVLLDLLSPEDVAYNVERLRSEADAKMKHADRLEAWGRSRRLSA
jgi:hypothetical protein